MENIVGTHLMQFITTISMLTTAIENDVWLCPIESRGSRLWHNPSPPLSVNECLGIWQGFWQHVLDQHHVGRGVIFSPKSDKVCQHFSMIAVEGERYHSHAMLVAAIKFLSDCLDLYLQLILPTQMVENIHCIILWSLWDLITVLIDN